MALQTILFDFTLDADKTATSAQRQEVARIVRSELEHVFSQLELAYSMESPDNGYFSVLHENQETIVTCRIFQQGLLTINVEYYLSDGKEPLMSFDVCMYEVQIAVNFHHGSSAHTHTHRHTFAYTRISALTRVKVMSRIHGKLLACVCVRKGLIYSEGDGKIDFSPLRDRCGARCAHTYAYVWVCV